MSAVLEKVNDKVDYTLPTLQFDYEGLKAWAKDIVEPYSGQIVEADDITAIREEMAALNRIAQNLDRARIDTARAVSAPVTEFENQVKEVRGIILDARGFLDEQVKAHVEREREGKKVNVQFIIDALKDEHNCEDFEIEINPRWLNKSTAEKAITAEVQALILAYKKEREDQQALEQAKKDRIQAIENHCKLNEVDRKYSLSFSNFTHLQDLNLPLSDVLKAIDTKYIEKDQQEEHKAQSLAGSHIVESKEEVKEVEIPQPETVDSLFPSQKQLSINAVYNSSDAYKVQNLCEELEKICVSINVDVKEVA